MRRLGEEKGIVLIMALLFMLVLGLLGMSAMSSTFYDNRISGNKRISEHAFYAAEAGIQEVLGRFREGATGEIEDTEPLNSGWKRFIALKEMREAVFWLRLLRDSSEKPRTDLAPLLDESSQIVAILTATVKTARANRPQQSG